mmetsp:Transcript_58563/g.68400  ORF Transcript_58563/g.68400 Transcript_58563/m.68400 type:complete len:501 (-) Transcript_58563:563-2065(-)
MGKRSNESDVEYKARKKVKKEKKLAKREKKETKHKSTTTTISPTTANDANDIRTSKVNNEGATTTPCWNSFADAPFTKPIQQALTDAGFTEPSPIQARAWPVALAGKDLVGVAKTGSGKTLGFLLPVFHRISTKDLPGDNSSVDADADVVASTGAKKTPAPLCLVLSPTRELAIQIHGECVKFGTCLNIRSECLYGGTDVRTQLQKLRAADPQVIICTPGRLCDLIQRKALSLSHCPFAVLDEADRMLDMGFEKELNAVMKELPKIRQTLFFTATWPKAVRRVAKNFLRTGDTVEVFIGEIGAQDGELAANKAVTQTFIEAQDDEKDKKLYDLLCGLEENASVVIFANTKRRVDVVASRFWQEGFSTVAVHGDKPQHERDASLKKFMTKQSQIMVATDVAARGLDIKGVTHVINFDMARDVESYVHRIGRTGRAGEVGEAVTFWNPDYDKECSPALVVIAKNAGQTVPPFLQKYQKSKASKQWKVASAERAANELIKGSA